MQIGKNMNFFRWVSFSALFSSLSHSLSRGLFRDFPTIPHSFTKPPSYGWVCVWVGLASPCGHNLTNKKKKKARRVTNRIVRGIGDCVLVATDRQPVHRSATIPPLQWREGGHFSRAPRSTYVRSEGARKWNLCTSEKRMPQMVTLAGWLLWQHWMVLFWLVGWVPGSGT